MGRARAVQTCEACRKAKVRCDRARPRCLRCQRAGRECSYREFRAEDVETSYGSSSVPCTALSDQTDRASPCQVEDWLEGVNSVTSPPPNSTASWMPRRRKRTAITCTRCRRMKVRCDRGLPCGRCVKIKKANECTYEKLERAVDDDGLLSMSTTEVPQGTHSSLRMWRSKFRTENHWAYLIRDMEKIHSPACLQDNNLIPQEDLDYQESLLANYPFGERPRRSKSTRKTTLAFIPNRPIADKFVDAYLEVLETSYRLLHVPTFKLQIQAFWNQPSAADDGWLAQYLVILALGCLACNADPSNTTKPYSKLPNTLLAAAETCLRLTPFLCRPTLATLRTLCLMVIAKQVNTMSCAEHEACWPLTGLIVRLAMATGLHSKQINKHYSSFHAEMRNRLWTVICFMDLKQSLHSGMPLQITPDSFTSLPPSNINEDDIHEAFDGEIVTRGLGERADSTILVIFYDIFPLFSKILRTVSSMDTSFQYEDAIEYDRQVRLKMKEYELLFEGLSQQLASPFPSSPRGKDDDLDFQKVLLNVFYRHALLTLHGRFAKLPHAHDKYPVAYWSSLECSLALLGQQRELCEQTEHVRRYSAWFSGLFKQDFFTAAMTLCFHLIKNESPLELPADHLCQIQARETVLETLRCCRDLWEKAEDKSGCHGRACQVVNSLVHHLEGMSQEEDQRPRA